MAKGSTVTGVYFESPSGAFQLVHAYQDGDYLLTDVVELFVLGKEEDAGADGEAALVVSREELREIKIQADAQSFDHEEGFIEMCLDIWRFGSHREEETLRFVSIE